MKTFGTDSKLKSLSHIKKMISTREFQERAKGKEKSIFSKVLETENTDGFGEKFLKYNIQKKKARGRSAEKEILSLSGTGSSDQKLKRESLFKGNQTLAGGRGRLERRRKQEKPVSH